MLGQVFLEVRDDRAWAGLLIEFEPGLQSCFEELTLMGQQFEGLIVAQALKLVGQFGFRDGGAVFEAQVDEALMAIAQGNDLAGLG
jgi:hypothetical protein